MDINLIDRGICPLCKTNPALSTGKSLFCWRCIAKQMKKRHARQEMLKGQPRMTWPQFVELLAYYDYMAGLDFEWSYLMYETYGRHLAQDGVLGDIPELIELFNLRTYMGHPAELREADDILESTQPQQEA